MVIFDPPRTATRTPPRPERRGGPSGGPAGGPRRPLDGLPGVGPGGWSTAGADPLPGPSWGGGGPPPPRAGWRGGGPPPPRASRRGGGPPGEGGLAGVDPQAWDPRTGPRGELPGGYRGGRPRLPGLPRRTERGGFRSGGGPRPVLGPGSSPLDGIPGIRAPGAKKNAMGPGGGPAGDHELRHGARGPGYARRGMGVVEVGLQLLPRGSNSYEVDPRRPRRGPGRLLRQLDRAARGAGALPSRGVKGEILFASPPVKPPEGAGCSSGASCGIAVVARGHRCRVRRRHAGGAYGRACDRGSPPSKFLNLVQGL